LTHAGRQPVTYQQKLYAIYLIAPFIF